MGEREVEDGWSAIEKNLCKERWRCDFDVKWSSILWQTCSQNGIYKYKPTEY